MPRGFTRAVMAYSRFRYWWPLERLARRPDVAQSAALIRLLAANRDTRFGIAHGFADIRDHRSLQNRVPIQDYETLRPYIDDQRTTGARALTAEAPVFYSQTSGTTSKPKHIPMTPSVLAMHRDEQALFSYLQFRACPRAFDGKALGIMGAAVEGRLDSGHSVGSVSGHLYESLPSAVRSRFVVPPRVFSIADHDLSRVDANNLWKHADEAILFLRALGPPLFAVEEPIAPNQYAGLSRIAAELDCKIVLDESFLRLSQLDWLRQTPDRWLINLRVSKMGGLLRSLGIADAARVAHVGLVIGAQVGETSVLTRAALTVAQASRDIVVAQEGAFGTHLLEHDVCEPVLMFGEAGILDASRYRSLNQTGFGLVLSRSVSE